MARIIRIEKKDWKVYDWPKETPMGKFMAAHYEGDVCDGEEGDKIIMECPICGAKAEWIYKKGVGWLVPYETRGCLHLQKVERHGYPFGDPNHGKVRLVALLEIF